MEHVKALLSLAAKDASNDASCNRSLTKDPKKIGWPPRWVDGAST